MPVRQPRIGSRRRRRWEFEYLYITQIRQNRILRYDPKPGVIDTWRTCTNGHLFKAQTERVGWAMFP